MGGSSKSHVPPPPPPFPTPNAPLPFLPYEVPSNTAPIADFNPLYPCLLDTSNLCTFRSTPLSVEYGCACVEQQRIRILTNLYPCNMWSTNTEEDLSIRAASTRNSTWRGLARKYAKPSYHGLLEYAKNLLKRGRLRASARDGTWRKPIRSSLVTLRTCTACSEHPEGLSDTHEP